MGQIVQEKSSHRMCTDTGPDNSANKPVPALRSTCADTLCLISGGDSPRMMDFASQHVSPLQADRPRAIQWGEPWCIDRYTRPMSDTAGRCLVQDDHSVVVCEKRKLMAEFQSSRL